MPVPPYFDAYGDDPELERKAAELWRKENPDKSVFECNAETKERYRRRAALAATQGGGT